jgi:NADH-quinone oxidoreductase subunit H
MLSTLYEFFKPHLLPLLFAVVIVALVPLVAGYLVLLERKVMADMQARLGPMRVGPHGLLQPIADALKLLIKEDIIPANSDKWIFWLAPVLSVTAGMLAMAAIPFGPFFLIANLNVGLLFILGVSSMGIFGIVLGGWASNSHYSLLGALRSSAQLVSYETAAGMAVVSAVMLGGTLSMKGMVEAQVNGHVWFIFVAPIGFFLYLVASIAETNRAPFDMPEAESELVAGYMTEYSGFRWALYFLAEYTNMIVVASIATTLFLGGWLRPLSSVRRADFLDYVPMLLMLLVAGYSLYRAPKQPVAVQKMFMVAVAGLCFLMAVILALPQFAPAGSVFVAMKPGVHGAFWFLLKVGLYLYLFLWLRFTFPRYRFDQLMKLGWHFLIPVSIVNVFSLGVALYLHRSAEEGGYGWGMWASVGITTVATLLIAVWLLKKNEPGPVNPALDQF